MAAYCAGWCMFKLGTTTDTPHQAVLRDSLYDALPQSFLHARHCICLWVDVSCCISSPATAIQVMVSQIAPRCQDSLSQWESATDSCAVWRTSKCLSQHPQRQFSLTDILLFIVCPKFIIIPPCLDRGFCARYYIVLPLTCLPSTAFDGDLLWCHKQQWWLCQGGISHQ